MRPVFLKRLVALAIACSSVAISQKSPTQGDKCAAPVPVADAKYAPGQVWTYKTREKEPSSTLTILRIESTAKMGTIIYVRIDDTKIKNCSNGSVLTSIGHAPFSKSAIDRSVVDLVRTEEKLPEFQEGYTDWLAHCGGVYKITVAEAVAADESTLNSGAECAR